MAKSEMKLMRRWLSSDIEHLPCTCGELGLNSTDISEYHIQFNALPLRYWAIMIAFCLSQTSALQDPLKEQALTGLVGQVLPLRVWKQFIVPQLRLDV